MTPSLRPTRLAAALAIACAFVQLSVRAEWESTSREVGSPESSRIRGRCIDQHGAPLAGVRIGMVVDQAAAHEQPVVETWSDHEGRFHFEVLLPDRRHELCAVSGGFAVEHRRVRSGDVELSMTPEVVLTGSVTTSASGDPIVGADIWTVGGLPGREPLQAWVRERGLATAKTDRAGTFTLRGLRAGEHLSVHASAWGSSHALRKVVVLRHTRPIEIALETGVPELLEVVDSTTGAPVSGITAIAGYDRKLRTLDLDAPGKIRWTRPWDSFVRIRAPGYADGGVNLELMIAQGMQRLELERAAVHVGTVRGPGGRPVPGACVRWNETADEDEEWIARESRTTLTGRDGNYRFDRIRPRKAPIEVEAVRGSLRTETPIEIRVPGPGIVRGPDLILTASATIEGRVTAGGRPCTATVRLADAKRTVHTDANGNYRARNLAPGPHRVAASLGPSAFALAKDAARRDVAAGETLRWDFELYPAGSTTLSGHVVRSDGTPAAAHEVTATREGVAAVQRLSQTTDERGGFRFEVPDDDADWTISARLGRTTVELPVSGLPSDGLELRLPSTGTLGVRLVDREDGRPLRVRELSWRADGGRWIRAKDVTRRSGVYWIELPSGSIDLRIAAPTPLHFGRDVYGLSVAPESERVEDVVIASGVRLAIRLDPPPEFPLDMMIRVRRDSGQQRPVTSVWDGSLTCGPLISGGYRLELEGVTFHPSRFELGTARRQTLDASWEITDEEAHAEALRKMMGLMCGEEHF